VKARLAGGAVCRAQVVSGQSVAFAWAPPGNLFLEFIDNLAALFRGGAEQKIQCGHESLLLALVQIDKREESLGCSVLLVF
jgi:hypothetical protein